MKILLTGVEISARLEKIVTEREGMIAANIQRKIEGKSLAYDEKSFLALNVKIDEILTTIGTHLKKGQAENSPEPEDKTPSK